MGVARAAREENFEACRCQRAGKCPMPRIARNERLEIDVDREEEAEQASLEAGEVSPAPTESLRNGNAGVEPAGSGPAAAEEAAADRTQQARGQQQPPRSQHVDDDDSEEGEELGPHTELPVPPTYPEDKETAIKDVVRAIRKIMQTKQGIRNTYSYQWKAYDNWHRCAASHYHYCMHVLPLTVTHIITVPLPPLLPPLLPTSTTPPTSCCNAGEHFM